MPRPWLQLDFGRLYKIRPFLPNSGLFLKKKTHNFWPDWKQIDLNLETPEIRFSIVKPKRQLFIVVPKLSLGMKILHDCEKICTTQQFLLEI